MHKYLKELSEIAEEKGGKLLSLDYSGSHSKYLFVDELGNQFEARGYSIKNGRWSPFTSNARKIQNLRKYSVVDMCELAFKKGGKCLATEYTGYKSKYLWVDSSGREFYKTLDEILSGQWSPYEKSEKLRDLKLKYTIQDLDSFAVSKGGRCLSTEYTTNMDKYTWVDRNGREFERSWAEIQRAGDVLLRDCGSKEQKQLTEYIESLGFTVQSNVRGLIGGKKELDLYIPDLKIAIEMNGAYRHSEKSGKDRKYHLEKYKACVDAGVTLLQIFDFEWNNRQEQVKSFLMSKFGKNSRRVFARKTTIQQVDTASARDFLNKYHIQGAVGFHKAFGLYDGSELLALLTVGKHHRNNSEWVLSRFVGKTGVSVAGGLSRLVSAALEEFGALSTWVDLRFSTGENWVSSGWNLDKVLPPDYFYFTLRNGKIVSKQSRKKSSVSTPDGMTELEHAEIDGLTRVWDCGKLKLVIEKQ